MKIHKFIPIISIIIGGFAIQYFVLGKIKINDDIVSNIITFLSIIYGFYISSLSIFASSSYVSKLYLIGTKDRATLLHVLVNNYKQGLIIISISIFYFLILSIIIGQKPSNNITFLEPEALLFTSLNLLNFYYSYVMLSDLIKIIIQEAKSKK